MKKPLQIISILLLITFHVNAQQIPNAAPSSSIKQELGISELTVNYRRPAVQKRQIRTGNNPVIPTGKVWNTSISIASNTDFTIANKPLRAGKYTLYAIPESAQWTLILKKVNEETDDQDEILRTSVTPETIPFTETLETRITDITDSTALLSFSWDTFSLPLKIAVATNLLVLKSYQHAVLTQHTEHGNTLQYGTWFLLTRNYELPLALEWIDKDISTKETYYNSWLKAQVLRKLNRTDEAIHTAQRALDLALVSSDIDFANYVPRIRAALEFWPKIPGPALSSAE